MKKAKTIVLIHGAWHGSWCWFIVKELLEKEGHRVILIDLPGLSVSRHIPVTSLEDHVNAVTAVVTSIEGEVEVWVHSYAGILGTVVAELLGVQKISKLGFISAFAPENGKSLFDYAGADQNSLVTQHIVPPTGDGFINVDPAWWQAAFYNDCEEKYFELAKTLLTPQPFVTFTTPVYTTEKYDAVPKVYISCLQDRAITPDAQKGMYSKLKNLEQVFEIHTDHSPFFSTPRVLSRLICKA